MGGKKKPKTGPGEGAGLANVLSGGAGLGGGRRPQRHRTQVQHYTDDIPGTFTKKKKRRRTSDESGGGTGSSHHDSDSDESDPSHHPQLYDQRRTFPFHEYASLEDVAAKNNNNKANTSNKKKRKAVASSSSPATSASTANTNDSMPPPPKKKNNSNNTKDNTSTTTGISNNSVSVNSNSNNGSGLTVGKKAINKQPPHQQHQSQPSSNKLQQQRQQKPKQKIQKPPPRRQQQPSIKPLPPPPVPKPARPIRLQEKPPPKPPKTTMLAHTASVAPILPLANTCPLLAAPISSTGIGVGGGGALGMTGGITGGGGGSSSSLSSRNYNDNHNLLLEQQYPVMFGRGLGIPQPPSTPEWKFVANHDFYFPQDYTEMKISCPPITEAEEVEPSMTTVPVLQRRQQQQQQQVSSPSSIKNNLNDSKQQQHHLHQQPPWPVCRVVTSLCSHKNHMAVGDSAGFVSVYTTGPSSCNHLLTRYDTSASHREYYRQRKIQAEIENKCRNKPELLQKRSPFWATAKTPNAVQCMTWTKNLLLILTAQEIEAIQLLTYGDYSWTDAFITEQQQRSKPSSIRSASTSRGGSQHCRILWTIPVTTIGDSNRKNGSNSLLTGGELVGSYLELNKRGTMVLWNTWGVAAASSASSSKNKKGTKLLEEENSGSAPAENEQGNNHKASVDPEEEEEEDWPLLLMRDPAREPMATATTSSPALSPDFIKIIPFQRDEEEEKPPPIPIKRSPGRPPKKKPKPKIPVKKDELIWTKNSRCHAALWDNNNRSTSSITNSSSSKGERLVIAYSTTSTLSAADSQVFLSLLKLTDDMGAPETVAESSSYNSNGATISTKEKPQFARLLKQIAVPLVGSARNIANVPEVTLKQSPRGTYTLVAGSRGVRMYQTETMTLLRVYGENVSLHGKTMVWKSCFVLDNRLQQQLYRQQEQQLQHVVVADPATTTKAGGARGNAKAPTGSSYGVKEDEDEDEQARSKTVLRQNRQGFVWIEQENLIASLVDYKDASSNDSGKVITRGRSSMQQRKEQESNNNNNGHFDNADDDDESHWLHQAWIVGIPHPFRGPKELQETLYFWQGIEKLPLFTLPLPHQSGGVQDMLPLVSPPSNRNKGMWLRFMVATVHGECMELAPSVKSDFAGIMYNPGYFVVQENVDYIEDEDELDKVMVEVQDEKEEPEEEVVAPPLGTTVDGEIVDEELQEAIRLSLLESKGKPKVSDENVSNGDDDDDETVVVRDVFGDDDNELVVPCEPEPFLRKKLMPEFESDTMINVNDATNADISAKDAEFFSDVLSTLPQSERAQKRWDQQKNVVPPPDVLKLESPQEEEDRPTHGSVNTVREAVPLAAGGKSFGKGKRSRPGNLETMMKASLDPELRQYMTDRALCWADGGGARLQEDAWDHPVATAARDSEMEVGTDAPGETTTLEQGEQEKGNEEKVGFSTEGRASTAPSSSTNDEDQSSPEDSAAGNEKGAASIPPSTGGALSVQIPDRSKTDVEKEIALELLQLSPRPTAHTSPRNAPPEMNIGFQQPRKMQSEFLNEKTKKSSEVDLGGVKVAIIELKDYSGITEQYSCTGTVDIPLTLKDCGLAPDCEDEVEEVEESEVDTPEQGGVGAIEAVASGKDSAENVPNRPEESKEAETTENNQSGTQDVPQSSKQEASKEEPMSMSLRCAACQGRMVVHICGKRALPIDFEAIAREEKERKEKEEEEKKRLKIEKRKQADAKRREAKKLKKEREKRAKVEKEAELRRMREEKVAEARANMANIGECLATDGSPPMNGVMETIEEGSVEQEEAIKLPKASTGGGADSIHFAIADAWKEHAEKFTVKESVPESPVAITDATADTTADAACALPTESHASQLNTLDALATMAEAATPQVGNPLQRETQATSNPAMISAPAPSTPHLSPPPTDNQHHQHVQHHQPVQPHQPVQHHHPAQHHLPAPAAHQPVQHHHQAIHHQQPAQHGFFSSPAASATSAALIARRNQVLNSYHAMEAGSAGVGARVVDLSHQDPSSLNTPGEGRAHSFQINPLPNATQAHRVLGQPNLAIFHRHAATGVQAAAPRPAQPYFGYTQLSSHFRPRVNLGSYSSAAIFTASRPPQPAPQAAPASAESQTSPPRAPVLAPNRDSYFPGSQPQPAAAVHVAPPAPPRASEAVTSAAPNMRVWMHPSQALAQARAVPAGAVLVQPQLGAVLAPAGHNAAPSPIAVNATGVPSAQYHQLRPVQPAAGPPLDQHINNVVYKKPATTTNP